VLFEHAAQGVGAIFRRFVEEFQETLGEPLRKVLYLIENLRKELALIGTHGKKE
jgi:hypothetical protein